MQKKHYVEIDALKGWAIFLVVLGHSIIIYPVNIQANAIWGGLFAVITAMHMPLFFLVSGYCYSYKGVYGAYILKKVRRLLVPYFVFCLVEMLPKFFLADLINRPRGIGESLIKMLFYGGDYWFLWTLFMIFLFYPALDKLLRRNKCAEIVGLVVLAAISIVQIRIEFWEINAISKYLFWFYCGVLLKNKVNLFAPENQKGKPLVNIVVLVSICAALYCFVKMPSGIAYNCKKFVIAALGILIALNAVRFKSFNDFFARFGKYSLQLYLLNGILLGISRTFICNVLGVETGIVIVLFNMLVDFFLSYLIVKYVCEKIKPVRVLMGMVS